MHTQITDIADKPMLVVDNFPGTGQGDVYLVVTYLASGIQVSRSLNGVDWQVRTNLGGGSGPFTLMALGHVLYVFWVNGGVFKFSKSSDRGTNFTAASNVVTFNNSSAKYEFLRFTGAPTLDTFRSPILPSIAANPVNGHLYMTYPDWPTSTSAKPNIYFLQSTNSGTNWSPQPLQMNWSTNSSTTDRWEPTLTVKPDGTKLFTAWYDRRADPGSNNFLIQTYGVFANLPITGTNNFATNVVLSTVAFPPVFSGTQTNLGEYDPVYPPLFDGSDSRYCGSFVGTYKQENGDYSGATSDNSFVYYAWSDNRNTATNHSVIRHQRDVRAVRFSWPR